YSRGLFPTPVLPIAHLDTDFVHTVLFTNAPRRLRVSPAMSRFVSSCLLRTAVVLALALPAAMSTHQQQVESDDLNRMATSSLSSPAFSASSSSALYPELGPRLVRSSLSSMRKKRISQMSCHCCSNSFNSHCCLKCMQRVGKRSNTVDRYTSRQTSDRQGQNFAFNPLSTEVFYYTPERIAHGASQLSSRSSGLEQNDKPLEAGGVQSLGIRCFCCVNQILENPEAAQWPCCDNCLSQGQ
ncbi:hypothetical protein EGW08_003441, partial [Elysia chlorotica]